MFLDRRKFYQFRVYKILTRQTLTLTLTECHGDSQRLVSKDFPHCRSLVAEIPSTWISSLGMGYLPNSADAGNHRDRIETEASGKI